MAIIETQIYNIAQPRAHAWCYISMTVLTLSLVFVQLTLFLKIENDIWRRAVIWREKAVALVSISTCAT